MAGEFQQRNYVIAARVWSGELTAAGYAARIAESGRQIVQRLARRHSSTLPEITDDDLARMRAEIPGRIARLRAD